MLDRDQPLPPLSEFLEGLSDVTRPVFNAASDNVLLVNDIKVSLPFELGIEPGLDEDIFLAAAPPTQQTETSIMPVLHTIRVHVVLDEEAKSTESTEAYEAEVAVTHDGK